jgi:hypothetical protein
MSRQHILVPRLSKKRLGRSDTINLPKTSYQESLQLSSLDLEHIYAMTSIRVMSKTEMRVAWKPTDLKPRVFYAQGGLQHYASSLLQHVFNTFVDHLPITHRHGRFATSHLNGLNEDYLLLIYDYSSFTSTLKEIRAFCAHLADFFRGIVVRIVDAVEGIVPIDLGDLLHEYNDTCNTNPDFDVSLLLEVEDMVLSHSAGMLGVPGNITASTLIHGIHLAVIVGSLYRGKVVGDDAIGLFHTGDWEKESIVDAIRNLGDVAMEKAESWDPLAPEEENLDDRWDYVKRTINRTRYTVIQGKLPDVPDLRVGLGITNPSHTVIEDTPESRRRKFIRSHIRFLERNSLWLQQASELVIKVYTVYFRRCFNEHRLDHRGGFNREAGMWHPPCFDTAFSLPSMLVTLPTVNDVEYSAVFPCLEIYEEEDPPEEIAAGCLLYRKIDRITAYGLKMGWLVDHTERVYVEARELVVNGIATPRFLRSLNSPHRLVVDNTCPSWFCAYLSTPTR